jgi:hypothetical protein
MGPATRKADPHGGRDQFRLDPHRPGSRRGRHANPGDEASPRDFGPAGACARWPRRLRPGLRRFRRRRARALGRRVQDCSCRHAGREPRCASCSKRCVSEMRHPSSPRCAECSTASIRAEVGPPVTPDCYRRLQRDSGASAPHAQTDRSLGRLHLLRSKGDFPRASVPGLSRGAKEIPRDLVPCVQ